MPMGRPSLSGAILIRTPLTVPSLSQVCPIKIKLLSDGWFMDFLVPKSASKLRNRRGVFSFFEFYPQGI
jgi:hypothetical protein